MGARVLLVGMGAREHAVAWRLRQSPDVDAIYVAPGNAGTAQVATNVPIGPKDIDALVQAAADLNIDFYLATMDDPQPLGLVDRLRERGLPCYGPTAQAAQLEASKAWSKQFMVDHGITTAAHRAFRDHREAVAYVESLPDGPLVVKASGLAAGKGALVCDDRQGALAALETIMVKREFGAAGDEVVVEERLQGWETSAHAICDGEDGRVDAFVDGLQAGARRRRRAEHRRDGRLQPERRRNAGADGRHRPGHRAANDCGDGRAGAALQRHALPGADDHGGGELPARVQRALRRSRDAGADDSARERLVRHLPGSGGRGASWPRSTSSGPRSPLWVWS